jgi:hypothetical protein
MEITYLEQTCIACPEQYDVYLDNSYVGYLRLRYGRFTFVNTSGNVFLLGDFPGDLYMGSFNSDKEKYLYLLIALSKLEMFIYK